MNVIPVFCERCLRFSLRLVEYQRIQSSIASNSDLWKTAISRLIISDFGELAVSVAQAEHSASVESGHLDGLA